MTTHSAATRSTVRVLLVDDHPVVREGMRSGLTTEPGIDVVDEAAGEAVAVAPTPC